MIILDGKSPIKEEVYTKVVIGKFDGVHVGHRKLISDMVNSEDELCPMVFTFSFDSSFSLNDSNHIYTEDERRAIFEKLGVKYIVEYVLDKESASVDPEEFVREILVKRLHVKKVFCGPDLSFGNRGKGNVDTIKGLSKELEISVCVIEKEQYMGEDISSTRIREAIAHNDTEDAQAMLGNVISHFAQ